ncbi:MAG: fimbrial assembly protein [Terracidiphilus sp.]|jgi:type IV pilus assembly protein PilN
MHISLNLATRPYADLKPALKRLRIGMAVLVVLAGGLYLGLRAVHQKAEDARANEQKVQNKIDAINKERQGYQDMMRQPANAELLAQAGTLNQIFDVKTFSWTLAMEDLETVLPGGVQVTTLEPVRDTKTGVITLKLRVVGPRDRGDDLVQNLEHSKHFLLPHIVSEASETTGSGRTEQLEPVSASNRFSFELLADYNSAAPPESKAEKKREEEKSEARQEKATAAAKSAGKSAPPKKTAPPKIAPTPPPTAAPPPQPRRQLNNGPGWHNRPGNLKPNPGGQP